MKTKITKTTAVKTAADKPTPATLAIAEAGMWKSSVDLTLVRHGKEIVTISRIANRQADALFHHEDEIKRLSIFMSEFRVLIAINATVLLGVIAAVSYIICKL